MCWPKRSRWVMPKQIPTLDVGGGDTAHKLALLASLAFGIKPDLVEHDDPGHRAHHAARHRIRARVRLPDQTARYRAARRRDGIDQRVQPSMVKLGTPLADVEGAFNVVVADAGEAGPFFFEGRGAGEAPTASAVVADLVDIARGARRPDFRSAGAKPQSR